MPDWAMFWGWVAVFGIYHYGALRFWATQPADPLSQRAKVGAIA